MAPLLLALTAATAAATATPTLTSSTIFDIGEGDWASYPALRTKAEDLPIGAMMARMETIISERQCAFRGQRADAFDVTVPWAMEIGPNGRVSRVIIADMGCRPLEEYVATLIQRMTNAGGVRIRGESRPGRYGSDFNFTLANSR